MKKPSHVASFSRPNFCVCCIVVARINIWRSLVVWDPPSPSSLSYDAANTSARASSLSFFLPWDLFGVMFLFHGPRCIIHFLSLKKCSGHCRMPTQRAENTPEKASTLWIWTLSIREMIKGPNIAASHCSIIKAR